MVILKRLVSNCLEICIFSLMNIVIYFCSKQTRSIISVVLFFLGRKLLSFIKYFQLTHAKRANQINNKQVSESQKVVEVAMPVIKSIFNLQMFRRTSVVISVTVITTLFEFRQHYKRYKV